MRQYLCIVMPICYERWCHQYSGAGQSSQKTSLWIKAVLTGYDHSHIERDSCGAAVLFIHFLREKGKLYRGNVKKSAPNGALFKKL